MTTRASAGSVAVGLLIAVLGLVGAPPAAHAAEGTADTNTTCNAEHSVCTTTTTNSPDVSTRNCSNPTGTGACTETTTRITTCTTTSTYSAGQITSSTTACPYTESTSKAVEDSLAPTIGLSVGVTNTVQISDPYAQYPKSSKPVVEERVLGTATWKPLSLTAFTLGGQYSGGWRIDGFTGAGCMRITTPAQNVKTTTVDADAYRINWDLHYQAATITHCLDHAATVDTHWVSRSRAIMAVTAWTTAQRFEVQVSKHRTGAFRHFKWAKGSTGRTVSGPTSTFMVRFKKPAHGKRYYRIVLPQAVGSSRSVTSVVTMGHKGLVGASKKGWLTSHLGS